MTNRKNKATAAATTLEKPKEIGGYRSTSLNLEKRLLKVAKAHLKTNRQFRSVSALFNYHMARVLGLDL